jgi:pilus assembly protein CpaB
MSSGFGMQRQLGKEERAKFLLFAAVGLVISLIVVLIVVMNYKSRLSQAAVVDPNAQLGSLTVFLAEQPVYIGQRLSDVSLREASWPRQQASEDVVTDLSQLQGMFAQIDIPQGVPLTKKYLTETSPISTLPVTPGNRAITIEVDATTGLEGLALPGTRVDVFLTYSKEGELTTKVIVQNARVLSSGGSTSSFNQQQQLPLDQRVVRPRPVARTITIDVAPKDALRISTARQLGRLSLVMRSNEDTGKARDIEFDAGQFEGEDVKSKREASAAAGCTRGHYKVNGIEFQLNCDGTRMQLHNYDEP